MPEDQQENLEEKCKHDLVYFIGYQKDLRDNKLWPMYNCTDCYSTIMDKKNQYTPYIYRKEK